MKSKTERTIKKRAKDIKHSYVTKTERAKSKWKEKRELKHSSLQNQCWSWRLEYYSFLLCFKNNINSVLEQKTIIFKSPTPTLVLETWMFEFALLFSFALGSFCFSDIRMFDIFCSLLYDSFCFALHPSFLSSYITFKI